MREKTSGVGERPLGRSARAADPRAVDARAPRDVGVFSKTPSSPKIAVITEPENKTGENGQASSRSGKGARAGDVYLPSGSILTGVLLNGMDAPTTSAARHDPFPSTLRLKWSALLPNRAFDLEHLFGNILERRIALVQGLTFPITPLLALHNGIDAFRDHGSPTRRAAFALAQGTLLTDSPSPSRDACPRMSSENSLGRVLVFCPVSARHHRRAFQRKRF